ncbi:DUF1285 domain-containing protein [Psychrobacter sp. N25K4-3-2]|jgi:hypothetical protein|uniref:DUF1285 domain-containing protein n=1 Tax=Psychrobacter sp. N25K4-3-2 TaxID=2785026 RepID=UPI00188C1D3C|nr:DUF1285 domain-containing protein [Psychrobacter sp. N25K4-3-2]MBF4490683.1 DUF1285 domain-containing protein [Psychrobacter sp. N25K4-3-2]
MSNDNSKMDNNIQSSANSPQNVASNQNPMKALNQYLKSAAGTREGRAIPPLEKWHPEQVDDMDLVIKANGEWWHEGGQMTRESLVSLFATILWKEENNGVAEYFLKTPVQKLRIQVEDAPLLINDVGIVDEANNSWLEFTTTTGDVVRLDDEHPITLRAYSLDGTTDDQSDVQVRPYMPVRNGLTALIGRNVFYHLTEIGELTEQKGETILTLQSGGRSYELSMPTG